MRVHLRNGRLDSRHPTTRGEGVTWCGKKLIGKEEGSADGVTLYLVYGDEVRVTLDPEQGTCPACRERFDSAYNAAFPDGLKPIATIRLDDPDAGEKLKSLMHTLASAGVRP